MAIWLVLQAIWLFLPAMAPNSAALLVGGGTPIDFGRTMGKGNRRIFGDGKTWRGLIGGFLAGLTLGLILLGIAYLFGSETYWGFGNFPDSIIIITVLSFGALFGDLLGSFVKRRLGRERGENLFPLDQYDFVIGAFLFVLIFKPDWFLDHYIRGENIIALITILITIPVLHRLTNRMGYKMGKKEVPW